MRPDGNEMPNMNQRILIVDDDPVILEILNEGLKALGCNIDLAPDGTVALTYTNTKIYDLIITDWYMNVMDGNELIKRLRQFHKYKTTPVIFITSNKDINAVKQAKELGISKYLVKPINIKTLKETVLNILSK